MEEPQETAEISLTKAQGRLVKTALKTASERDSSLERSAELLEQTHGTEIEFYGQTEDMAEDPPTPVDLLGNFVGESDQRWVGTLTDYQALQTSLTVWITESLNAGQSVYEMMDEIEGIQRKIRRGVEETGGETVGPDANLFAEE